jgi:hypothetical protein
MESRTSLFFALSRLASSALKADWSSILGKEFEEPIREQAVLWLLRMEEDDRLGLVNHMLLACCGELIYAMKSKPSEKLVSFYYLNFTHEL